MHHLQHRELFMGNRTIQSSTNRKVFEATVMHALTAVCRYLLVVIGGQD